MDVSGLAPFPDIPLDIARLLFETAAWEHRPTARSLVLVSKVVRQWVEPLLYYSVALCTSSNLVAFHYSIFSRNDDAFFSRTVKVLCVGNRDTGALASIIHPAEQIWTCATAVLEVCTGVQRLAIWLIGPELRHTTVANGCLRPTHMSLLDLTSDYGWHSRQECVEILPRSLTHLNLDCENHEDIEEIPWQEIFARCPNLAHIIISGHAVSENFESGELFPVVVAPLLPELPDTVTTLCITTTFMCDPSVRNQLDFITNASDRVVVVSEDIGFRGLVRGLYAFEKEHTFDSEWGSWRGEDTWELVEKCVADRKRRRHDERNTEDVLIYQ
ncbi:hypothetical protein BDZ89DRAFT_1074574 [Hymenopellis radicata]|nr:hypothetical protein BDZ89DRAFT_1074574 [Hymenopellis radicata]